MIKWLVVNVLAKQSPAWTVIASHDKVVRSSVKGNAREDECPIARERTAVHYA